MCWGAAGLPPSCPQSLLPPDAASLWPLGSFLPGSESLTREAFSVVKWDRDCVWHCQSSLGAFSDSVSLLAQPRIEPPPPGSLSPPLPPVRLAPGLSHRVCMFPPVLLLHVILFLVTCPCNSRVHKHWKWLFLTQEFHGWVSRGLNALKLCIFL